MLSRFPKLAVPAGNINAIQQGMVLHWSGMSRPCRAGVLAGLAGFAVLESVALTAGPFSIPYVDLCMYGGALLSLLLAVLLWVRPSDIRYDRSFREVLGQTASEHWQGMALPTRILLGVSLLLVGSSLGSLTLLSSVDPLPAVISVSVTAAAYVGLIGLVVALFRPERCITPMREHWQRRDTLSAGVSACVLAVSMVLFCAVAQGALAPHLQWPVWAALGATALGWASLLTTLAHVWERVRKSRAAAT